MTIAVGAKCQFKVYFLLTDFLFLTQASELTFHQRLRSSAEHVLIYEDPILQQKARDCMALPKLLRKAAESLQQQAANTTGKI